MPDTLPHVILGAALIVGLLGVPLVAVFRILDQREIESGKPSKWMIALGLLLPSGTAAAVFLPGSPEFLRLVAVVFVGVLVGAIWSYAAIRHAPKVYWAVRYLIWKLTGLWPNR